MENTTKKKQGFGKRVAQVAAGTAVAFTVGLSSVAPSHAQVAVSTDPDPTTVLTDMQTGINLLDDIASVAAAVGMSSVVFGAGAQIFKRFIFS